MMKTMMILILTKIRDSTSTDRIFVWGILMTRESYIQTLARLQKQRNNLSKLPLSSRKNEESKTLLSMCQNLMLRMIKKVNSQRANKIKSTLEYHVSIVKEDLLVIRSIFMNRVVKAKKSSDPLLIHQNKE
jgi:hypothetical protein